MHCEQQNQCPENVPWKGDGERAFCKFLIMAVQVSSDVTLYVYRLALWRVNLHKIGENVNWSLRANFNASCEWSLWSLSTYITA